MFFIYCAQLIFQSYFYNDDTFNFNYAQAKAATGNTSEAEEVCSFFFKNTTCKEGTHFLITFWVILDML